MQRVDDVVGDAVALVLAVDELAGQVAALGVVGEQVAQQPGGRARTLRPDSSSSSRIADVDGLSVRRSAMRAGP